MNICGGKLISHKIPFGGIFSSFPKIDINCEFVQSSRASSYIQTEHIFQCVAFWSFYAARKRTHQQHTAANLFLFWYSMISFRLFSFSNGMWNKIYEQYFLFFSKNTSFMPESCRFHVNYLLIDCSYCVGLEP